MNFDNTIDENIHFPNGGFPPVYLCTLKKKEIMKENKNREFLKKGDIVSIKKILEARKNQ